jgi:hypothetical protein
MSIVLQSSGGGSVTLQEAVTASNLTITVPAVTGTMLTTASTGSVLQVVSVATTSPASTQGETYVDSGLSATITPTSATSKILVLVTQSVYIYRTGLNNQARAGVRLLRNSTAILTPSTDGTGPVNPYLEVGNSNGIYFNYMYPITYLDSPATTSATTYKTQGRITVANNNNTIVFQDASGTSTITLMEIAA